MFQDAMVSAKIDTMIEIKENVIKAYSRLYDCDMNKAREIVEYSSFIKTLLDNFVYAMHYNDEYWAKKIRKEYLKSSNIL